MATLRIASIAERHAFPFGVGVCFFKGVGCDLAVQRFADNTEWKNVDTTRVLVLGTFSAIFCGAWQYALFTKIMPRVCPGAEAFALKPISEKVRDVPGMRNLVTQVFIENGINNGMLYFPVFYSVQSWLEGAASPLREGPRKFLANAHRDVPDIWSVWVPVQFFNFGFSPLHLRVPVTAFVSAGWTCYLSWMRGSYKKAQPKE